MCVRARAGVYRVFVSCVRQYICIYILSHTMVLTYVICFPLRYQHKDGSTEGCVEDIESGKAVGMFLEDFTTQ